MNNGKMSKGLRLMLDYDGNRHPIGVMKDLGITYQHATPQSIGNQWWFWNCENIPDEFPEHISDLDLDPMEVIGRGLSAENAIKIRDYKNE